MEKDFNLKDKNTFRIPAQAKYWKEIFSREELIDCLGKNNLPVFVLGGGSNTLVSDFDGLVITLKMNNIKLEGDTLTAEAGCLLGEVLSRAAENNLSGLEWAIGIPGTIGGAVFGNAGAFERSIGNSVLEVEILEENRIKKLDCNACKFSYRDSVFKRKNCIILSVKFKLSKGENVFLAMQEYSKRRNNPKGFSIGSIFRNPEGENAWKLVDECGFRGKQIGGAKVSEEHTNWIINAGDATSDDVKNLIQEIKKAVKEKRGIDLQEEIRYMQP